MAIQATQLIGFGAAPQLRYSYRASAQINTSGTVRTFSGADIGGAASNRIVVVLIGGGGSAATVSAVTIGAVAATIANNGGSASDANAYRYAALAYASLPVGDTADIEVTWSSNQVNTVISVFAVYAVSGAVIQTIGAVDVVTTLSDTSDVAGGGVTLWCGNSSSSDELSGTSDATGPAVTEHYDAQIGSNNARFASYSQPSNSTETGRAFAVVRTNSGGIGIAGLNIA